MFEQSSKFQLVQLILDHPENCDLDAHERHDLSKRLAKIDSFGELEKIYDRLPEANQKPAARKPLRIEMRRLSSGFVGGGRD